MHTTHDPQNRHQISVKVRTKKILLNILAARAALHLSYAASPAAFSPPPPALRPVPRALPRGWVLGVSCSRRRVPIPDGFSSTSSCATGLPVIVLSFLNLGSGGQVVCLVGSEGRGRVGGWIEAVFYVRLSESIRYVERLCNRGQIRAER